MRRLAFNLLAFFGIAAIAGASGPAVAEEPPPTRVGRVSFVEGRLGFHAKGETEWSPAAVNYPVATGGSFRADPRSRAEIRIGAQTIALSSNTEIAVARLDEEVIQIAVPQGRIGLHLRQLAAGHGVEIDIPRGGVWLLQPGIYDINAGSPDHPARIMVFEGGARFVGGTLDQAIKAGEAAVIGGADTLTATLERAAPDAFVQWCRARDYRVQRLAAAHHVSPGMTGYEELDAYGTWGAVLGYGEVWYPRSVPAGWAPYRNGHWTWLDPWGWNWVDAAPWGFAPSHYGRWAFIDNAWGWVPGPVAAASVYAPALVAFLADPGAMLRKTARGPVVGWFPLAPGEAHWPSYTEDPGFVRAVNAGAVPGAAGLGPRPTDDPAGANLAFANRRASTIVAHHTFASTGRVAGAALPLSDAAVLSARAATQPPPRQPPVTQPPVVQPPVVQPPVVQPGAAVAASAAVAAGATTAAIVARPAASGGSQIAVPGGGTATAPAPALSARGKPGSPAPAVAQSNVRQVAAPSARAVRPAGARFGPAGPARAAPARVAAPRAAAPRIAAPAAAHGRGAQGGGPHFSGASSGPQGGAGAGPRAGGGGPQGRGGGPRGGGKSPQGAAKARG